MLDSKNTIYISANALEGVQLHLKSHYQATYSTLCPLPWLEDTYKLDKVFINLNVEGTEERYVWIGGGRYSS